MISRKKLNIIVSVILTVACLFAILVSNKNSSFSSPFSTNISPAPDSVGQKVEGVSTNAANPQGQASTNIDQSAQTLVTSEGQEIYRVVKVVDGDTIDVDISGESTRLRIIGIDTPETVDPRKPVQCFGKEASNKAKEILSGQFASIVADESQGNKDKYGRLLRYVYLPDGTDYGLYMISNGYAHEYTYNTPYEHQAQYKQAQIDAMSGNRGLWSPDTCSGIK